MIDAHQHYWDVSREDCTWPTQDLRAIYRSFGPEAYRQASEGSGLHGSVLVQSQACDSDTDYLLALAENNAQILAVVAWADLESPHAANRIRTLAEHNKVRGLRPMLQGIEDSAWILRDELEPAIVAMQEHHLRFDALVQPRHIKVLEVFAERYELLQIVIDHGAKPNIADDEYDDWAQGMERLASKKNVYCKLSGLVTEASPELGENPEILLPWINHLYKSFGAGKLMWGSDWPVVNLACSFKEWLLLSRRILMSCVSGPHKDEDLFAIYSGTAQKFYRIN